MRLALGARPRHALWLVLRVGIGPAALGACLGLATALVVSSAYVEPLLFHVRVDDPWTLATVALALLTAAVSASCPPALRVGRIDPATELRVE